jgi:hypothetical protein
MTAAELFALMVGFGETTREQIDEFFRLLADDTLANQEAMTLTPDDFGIVYTTIDGKTITVKVEQ